MTLKIYGFVIETLRLMAPLMREIGRHDVDLARQMRRAASSVALNLAEGAGNVVIDDALVDRLDRIAGTLHRLSH